jgi:hypothetical protein
MTEQASAYLFKLPEKVPEGRIIVHNQVVHAARLGERGFRAWLDPAGAPRRAACDCGWAPHLSQHYRVDCGEGGD